MIDRSTWDAVQRQLQSKRGRRGLKANSEPGREYAFRGLIVCGNCGRRMAIHNDRNRTYYRCRGIGAPDRCQGAWARDKGLLEWGDELFGRLGASRRSDFAQHLAAAREAKRTQGPGALTQVETAIERNRKLFGWNHITEEAYLAENSRLSALKSELVAAVVTATPPVELEGLLDAWRAGLPVIRRELLGRLFDGLEVNEGQIVRYVPRKDREAAVTSLVDRAWRSQPEALGFGGPGGVSANSQQTPNSSLTA
jgi:hypothetical protein